jgi:predicted phage terminase large subunit-like protein
MTLDLEAWADMYVAALYTLALNDFGLFRQLLHPDMLWDWWPEEVARELTRFSHDLAAGRRPKLALMSPPQHGKSWAIWDFISWISGKYPDRKTIYASYSDELGTSANRYLFRTISGNNAFRKIFPDLYVGVAGTAANNNLIEFGRDRGSFRNTTVEGAINGFGLHLGVIDDPVKGFAEAASKLQRNKTWEWFAHDFFTRFDKNAGLLIIMTRWHVDDVLGRMIEHFGDELRVLRYPALAETTSWRSRKVLTAGEDGRGRFEWKKQLVRQGEALFPEHKPLSFLEEHRKVMTEAAFQALYQQQPIIVGGGQIPGDKIKCRAQWDRTGIRRTVRYIDKAATADGGAYTAMVLMHQMYDKTFVISHVVRGQWSAMEREQKIRRYAQADRTFYTHGYKIVIEQEPGSGGKESAENTLRILSGFNAVADKVTAVKEVRAEPFIAQVQSGNVYYVAGGWNHHFLTEAEAWPHGRYRDQIDAAAGAYAWLIKEPGYDRTYRAFQPGFVDEDL